MAALIGLTPAELASIKSDLLACIHAVLVGSQSYSLAGRTFTRADLSELRQWLQDVNDGLALTDTTTATTRTYADLSHGS
jgi:hypothetical protein